MGQELTGKKVSFTYGNLLQIIDSSFYDGLGNEVLISGEVSKSYVDASLDLKVSKSGDIMSGTLIVPNISTNYIDYTPQTFINIPGRLAFDSDEGTMSLGLLDGGSLQIGKEIFDYYTNLSGVTLIDGDVVSTTSASGNRQAVTSTDSTNWDSAHLCIGVVTHGNTINEKVRVTKIGDVHQLNTDHLIEGEPIYVDPQNPRKLTSTMPEAPNVVIHVGTCMVKHTINGVISVDIQIDQRLQDLSDVDGTPLSIDGQFPVWKDASSVFDFDYNIKDYSTTSYVDSSLDNKVSKTGDTMSGALVVNASITSISNMVGQSTINNGLVVNNNSGGSTIDDFRVKTVNYDAIDVSSNNNSLLLMNSSEGKIAFYGAQPSSQSTGWAAVNGSNLKTLDVSSMTLTQLADFVATLVNELKIKGLIGG